MFWYRSCLSSNCGVDMSSVHVMVCNLLVYLLKHVDLNTWRLCEALSICKDNTITFTRRLNPWLDIPHMQSPSHNICTNTVKEHWVQRWTDKMTTNHVQIRQRDLDDEMSSGSIKKCTFCTWCNDEIWSSYGRSRTWRQITEGYERSAAWSRDGLCYAAAVYAESVMGPDDPIAWARALSSVPSKPVYISKTDIVFNLFYNFTAPLATIIQIWFEDPCRL